MELAGRPRAITGRLQSFYKRQLSLGHPCRLVNLRLHVFDTVLMRVSAGLTRRSTRTIHGPWTYDRLKSVPYSASESNAGVRIQSFPVTLRVSYSIDRS